MIRRNEKFIVNGEIPIKMIISCIKEYQDNEVSRLNNLWKYYCGEQDILYRYKKDYLPNNKLVCNNASYITDMITGYMGGVPATYNGKCQDRLIELNRKNDIVSHDTELLRAISIYGKCNELLYMSSDEKPYPKIAVIKPENSFVVYDTSVEENPLFGIRFYETYDMENQKDGYEVIVYTKEDVITYRIDGFTSTNYEEVERVEHYFGIVPLIEYKNNINSKGDFEAVITLIDAYNLLQSDRLNDKEQLVDSILAIYGASLGDSDEEVGRTAQMIREHKILELPEKGKAEYLYKNLTEADVEILKESIRDDIYTLSLVPCLSDKNFSIQASGVSMKYKLLGLEQKAKTKEAYFRKGLYRRIKGFENILSKKENVDFSDIEIIMNRSLPSNELEIANIVTMLRSFVSDDTLLGQIPFVNDIEKEKTLVKQQKTEAQELQNSIFEDVSLNKLNVDNKVKGLNDDGAEE